MQDGHRGPLALAVLLCDWLPVFTPLAPRQGG